MFPKVSIIAVLLLTVQLILAAVPAQALLLEVGTADIYEQSTGTYVATGLNLLYHETGPFGPVIWLDYTNDMGNSGTHASQIAWARGLTGTGDQIITNYKFNPGISVAWSGEWRLPSTVDGLSSFGWDGTSTSGYNITTSEMGYLYYIELLNKGFIATDGAYPQPGWGLNNSDPFLYLLPGTYWSGTMNSASGSPDYAWFFSMYEGYQDVDYIGTSYYGLAVRSAQLGPAVPEPSSLLLTAFGLAGLVGYRLRRRMS